ncbi:MAG: hypothetical protein NNA30_08515 [Nitrospira sp.]|nr:hypothetical protein [Nitrospira sp.]
MSSLPDPSQPLAEEFRRHLDVFYARLKLAPPYDSVEKAVRVLIAAVRVLPEEERRRLLADPVARWELFRQAFERSGLAKKHRGIIAGLARNRAAVDLPADYDHFLNLFV